MAEPISVVVTTHNRPTALDATLNALLAERARDEFEVIVVDDGSSPPVSLPHGLGVTLVRTPGVERSRARDMGACRARGSLLVFIDDDMTVGSGFVASHRKGADEFGDALCVGEVVLTDSIRSSAFGRFRMLIEGGSLQVPRGFVEAKNFCTAQNMSMRRRTFLEIGGFDPNIVSSEDQDLALRFTAKGGRIAYLKDATALHRDENVGIAAYCRRHEWGSRRMAPFLRRHPAFPENLARLRFDPAAWPMLSRSDRMRTTVRRVLATRPVPETIVSLSILGERMGIGDRALFFFYRAALGLHLFRGFRAGLAETPDAPPSPRALVSETPFEA